MTSKIADSLTKEESSFSFNRTFFRRLYTVETSPPTEDNSLLVEYRLLSHLASIQECLVENLLPLYGYSQNYSIMFAGYLYLLGLLSRDSYLLPDRLPCCRYSWTDTGTKVPEDEFDFR